MENDDHFCRHQDQAYFNVELRTPIVGCWIALDRATEANGCMRVLRGGHRQRAAAAAAAAPAVEKEAEGEQEQQQQSSEGGPNEQAAPPQCEPQPFPHYLLRDWQICDSAVEGFPSADVTAVPLSPGSVLFFHGERKRSF